VNVQKGRKSGRLIGKLTIVCYEIESAQKNTNLLENKIIIDNCLLQERNITY